jgi:hypothetical protein
MLGVRDVQKLLGILPSGSMLASHTNLLRSRQKDTRERENDIFRGLKAFKRGKKANARVSNRSKQTKPCLCSLLGSLSSQLNLGAQQPEREREREREREKLCIQEIGERLLLGDCDSETALDLLITPHHRPLALRTPITATLSSHEF